MRFAWERDVMAAKVRMTEGKRFIGYATIFDAEPSFDVLMIACPDARAFVWRQRDNMFTVDLGDAPAPLCAD